MGRRLCTCNEMTNIITELELEKKSLRAHGAQPYSYNIS